MSGRLFQGGNYVLEHKQPNGLSCGIIHQTIQGGWNGRTHGGRLERCMPDWLKMCLGKPMLKKLLWRFLPRGSMISSRTIIPRSIIKRGIISLSVIDKAVFWTADRRTGHAKPCIGQSVIITAGLWRICTGECQLCHPSGLCIPQWECQCFGQSGILSDLYADVCSEGNDRGRYDLSAGSGCAEIKVK